jgi:hypothetical protein
MADGSVPSPRVFDEVDFRRLLAWEIQRATRYQDFLSLCLARPEHAGTPNRGTLVATAHRLVEMLRSTDLVGLLGDTIGIILVHTPASDAILISGRMRDLLQHPAPTGGSTTVAGSEFRLSLASFPTDATSDTVLLEQAQARLTVPPQDAY